MVWLSAAKTVPFIVASMKPPALAPAVFFCALCEDRCSVSVMTHVSRCFSSYFIWN